MNRYGIRNGTEESSCNEERPSDPATPGVYLKIAENSFQIHSRALPDPGVLLIYQSFRPASSGAANGPGSTRSPRCPPR